MWPAARAGNGKRKAHHVVAVEGAHHLPTDFVGDHEHAQRNEFSIAEIPDFLLQRDASAELFDPMTAAQLNRVRAHRRLVLTRVLVLTGLLVSTRPLVLTRLLAPLGYCPSLGTHPTPLLFVNRPPIPLRY